MTSSMYGDLLPSHVRSLDAAVAGSPLAHEKFEWRSVDGARAGSTEKSELPAIFHVETGFLFSIEYHAAWQDEYGAGGPSEFRCFRSPGVQNPAETMGARTWDEVLFDFRLWLRLIAREIGHHDGGTLAPALNASRLSEVWSLVHPEIRQIARGRLEAKRYAEAVDVALGHVRFDESMAIAPLKAEIDEARAIHFLFLASLLRYQLDEAAIAADRGSAADG